MARCINKVLSSEIHKVFKESYPFIHLFTINVVSPVLATISPRRDLKMKPLFFQHYFLKICKPKTSQKFFPELLYPQAIEKKSSGTSQNPEGFRHCLLAHHVREFYAIQSPMSVTRFKTPILLVKFEG